MKSKLFNSILCASLLVFAVGCGKNKSGGGSSSYGINPYNQSASSQQLITNLNSWYNGTTEGSKATGVLKVQKKDVSSNNSQNCDSIDVFGLFNIPYCSYSYSSSSSNQGTVLSTQTLNVITDNVAIKSRNNPELNAIFNGTAGQILQATSVGNQAVRVDVLNNNVVTSYIIDMTYHSLLNPVVKITNGQTPTQIVTVAGCAFASSCNLGYVLQ